MATRSYRGAVLLILWPLMLWALLGCSTKRDVVLQPTMALPTWLTTPPQNTAEKLMGIGSGASLQEATQVALTDMLAKLSISIESSTVSHTHYDNGHYEETMISDIRSDISKIRVSNYAVVATEQIRFDQFVVWVASDRVQFANSLQREVDNQLDTIERLIQTASAGPLLQQYQIAEDGFNQAKTLIPTLHVLNSLRSDFDNARYEQRLQTLYAQRERSKKRLMFRLSEDRLSVGLSEPIQKALAQEGFRVVTTTDHPDTLDIQLETARLHSEVSGIQIVTLQVQLKIKDQRNLLISANQFSLKGHATQGYAHAQSDALKGMTELIHTQGIGHVLGIKLSNTAHEKPSAHQ